MKPAINDIWRCLQDAQILADHFDQTQHDQHVFRAFTSLAGDENVGFLAYVIWKGRNSWLSSLRTS
jgi:hypothetical protein